MTLIKRIFTALILTSAISAITATEVPVDKIEAVVNQDLILKSDLESMKRDIITRYQASGQPLPASKDFDKQVLDKLINDSLQLQIANSIGLRISDIQINQTIEELAKKENKSVAQLREGLEKSGVSYEAFVDNVRHEMTINEVRQIQVRKRINISDHEVDQMVERLKRQGQQTTEFQFSHILLKVSSASSSEKKLAVDKKAAQLIKEIKQGADIKKLAKTYSEGPKAPQGGDWGWRKLNEIPSMLASSFTEKTKKGDIIGPFRSSMGVHIIQILDKKGAQNIMTEEVNARHILIKPNVILSDEKAQQLLTTLRQQILDDKKTFSELAREHSQDPGSAVKGGELGWANPSIYVPEFRDAALTQQVGFISKPFRTVHGWHILEVLGKRKADVTEQAIKQRAYSILLQQRFPSEAYAWLNEIRQEAYIKITNPNYIIEEE